VNRDDIPAVVAILLVGAYAAFAGVCAFRGSVRTPANRTSPPQVGTSFDPKAAFDLLAAYHREYGSYHARKENMAWLVGTVAVGAAAAVMVGDGFWSRLKGWPLEVFWPFFLLCLVTAGALLLLLRFQNVNRRRGAAMFEASANTYVHWLGQGTIPPAALKATARPDYPRHEVPAAVARRYGELLESSRPSWAERLGYVVVGGWGMAALLRIVWARFGN
jgi:hypothetical protein